MMNERGTAVLDYPLIPDWSQPVFTPPAQYPPKLQKWTFETQRT